MTFIRSVLASLILGATGAYVLWQFHTALGLTCGLSAIALMLCIAFPTEIKPGAQTFAANAKMIVPVIVDALPGGKRWSDPSTKDPPKDGPP